MSVIGSRGADVLPAEGRAARRIVLTLLLVGAVAIQSTLFSTFTIMGVVPQLVLVVALALAFLEGEQVGAIAGFFGGLLVDLLSPGAIVGLSSFVYTLLGYGVGRAAYYSVPGSAVAPVALVALASLVGEFLYAGASVLLGQRWIAIADTVRIAFLVVAYNALLTPFVFPLVRRAVRRLERDRVIQL